jgi:uncharacterized protein YeaO (DUF488 family)
MTETIRVKRVYEPAEAGDGSRILVDRLWPRGLTKAKAGIDLWLKDIAPSDALRRRTHAEPEKWEEFVADYRHELGREPARSAAAQLREWIDGGPVTLLYASRSEDRNNATVLRDWLSETG